MSEHILHTNMRSFSVRTDGTYENVYARTYITHEYEIFSVRTYVTYENIVCPKLCYTQNMMAGVRTSVTLKMCNVHFSFTFSEFGPRHSLGR